MIRFSRWAAVFALFLAMSAPVLAQSELFKGSGWIDIDKKTVFPRMVWHFDSLRLRDSLAARALAVGDSLLAVRGWVRTFVEGRIADSLRWIPRGLGTPGALGYVWKTGPGGVQGWYPDSAGSSSGTVTSIATSAPITGGTITTTGTIGITQATTSTDGYVSSTDWNTFNDKAARADIRDSLRRNIHLQDYLFGEALIDGRYDSTKLVLVDGLGVGTSYTYGWSSHQPLFIAPTALMLDEITIRHSCDSLLTAGGSTTVQFWRMRDTTFTFATRDSIPAGARVYVYYAPASNMTVWNSTGAQILGVFYTTANDHTAYIIGDKVQVPRIVDNTGTAGRKIVASQAGYRTSVSYGGGATIYNHMLRVSVRTHRKVTGLNY